MRYDRLALALAAAMSLTCFAPVCALAQGPWFLAAYFIQAMNLSGAAGGLYVVYLCLRAPAGLLVNDDGVSMRFYLKKEDC